MTLVDATSLLHAYNSSSPDHAKAKRWLEAAFTGSETIGLAWVTILAFLRIGTSPRMFQHPLSPAEGIAAIAEWLALPAVMILNPEERHWQIFSELLTARQARGPLVVDAHLAALALEHGAELASTDKDFTRFSALKFFNPLEAI